MVDPISVDDLADEHAELLPAREVLSLLTDPTAMNVPGLLGPPQTADAGAGDMAGGVAGDASHVAGSAAHPDPTPGDTYSPTETASAG